MVAPNGTSDRATNLGPTHPTCDNINPHSGYDEIIISIPATQHKCSGFCERVFPRPASYFQHTSTSSNVTIAL